MEAGTTVQITMPEMGESVTEGTILEWLKQVGDEVEAEEGIVEVSTDRVDAELPSPVAGTVVEILAATDDVVATGTVVARIAVGAGEPAAAPAPAAKQEGAEAAAPQAAEPAGAPAPAGNGDANVTPVAARIASAHGLDLTQVSGSGPRGRVTKTDVLAAIEVNGEGEAPPAAAPRPAGTTPIRGPAATLARFMEESRSIPTATSFRTLEVDMLDSRRKQLKAAGKRLSFTHMIAWAIVEAARD